MLHRLQLMLLGDVCSGACLCFLHMLLIGLVHVRDDIGKVGIQEACSEYYQAQRDAQHCEL